MTQDRPLLGMALMLGFCLFAPIGDSVAKLLTGYLPVAQILLIRFALQVAFLGPVVQFTSRSWRLSPRVLKFTALRTVFHIAGVGFMFSALRFLELADAIAIAFVMPFILLLLGWFFLGEEVGPRRLIACAIGFAGTLMVVQPSFAEVGAPALLPFGVAVTFALFMLTTRQIAKDVDPIAMQAVSAVMATAVLVPALFAADALGLPGFGMVPIPRDTWFLILLLGLLGSFGHLFMTWSLRYAPSATLAPMQYLEIPIAGIIGWIIFSDLPDGLALAGMAVTVASGLYVVFREHATAARTIPPAPFPQALRPEE